jgi:glucose-6-phosphate 1-epimerase
MTADASPENAPEPGEGGLPRVVLTAPNGSRAEIYLHGAHVARWTDAGEGDVLYLSPRSRFEPGEAIRGGVPVIFPQFADLGPLPKHGFARTSVWTLAEAAADRAVLVLADTPETRAVWDHAFRAELRVELGAELSMTFAVENTGDDAFDFTCALHSYFRVSDVGKVAVDGLQGICFLDKVARGEHVQDTAELRFAGEVDRVYVDAPDVLQIRDGGSWERVVVRKFGFRDAVVWNPGAEKARAIVDLGGDAYPHFVCVEAACAAEPVRLEPGERWEGGQVLSAD